MNDTECLMAVAEEKAERLKELAEARERIKELEEALLLSRQSTTAAHERIRNLENLVECSIGLETKLHNAEQRMKQMEDKLNSYIKLLDSAKCPECDGSGFNVAEIGGCGPDGEGDTRECIQVQCQWCYERNMLFDEHGNRKEGE